MIGRASLAFLWLSPSLAGAQGSVAWVLQEQVRIGSVEAAGYSLTQVGDIVVVGDRVLITQPVEQSIRVYSIAGQPLPSIGRRGDGPGEFRALSALGRLGDTLYVVDERLRRITLFSLDGRLLGVRSSVARFPIPANGPISYLPTTPQYLMADGSALVKPGVAAAAVKGSGPPPVPIVRLSASGDALKTIAWQEAPNGLIRVPLDGRTMQAQGPFGDHALIAVQPNGSGVVVVHRPAVKDRRVESAQFWITRIAPSGDTLFSKSFEYQPKVLTDARIRAAASALAISLQRYPDPPTSSALEKVLREAPKPAALIPVTQVLLGQDGSIWLRREEPEPDVRMARWDVIDPSGNPLAIVESPKAVNLHAVTPTHAVGVHTDSLNVPFVVIFKIARPELLNRQGPNRWDREVPSGEQLLDIRGFRLRPH